MAATPASRRAFFPESQPSLADLIVRIAAASDLPKTTRQNWCWAIRTVARVGGKEPVAVAAHPEFLRRLMAKAAPIAAGLTAQAWNNARSLAGKALEWAGLARIPGRYMGAYTLEWQAFWILLPPKTALAHQLCRLLHYFSVNGIRPGTVTQADFERFYKALIEESLVPDPYEVYRGATKSWNNAAELFPSWPQVKVTVPTKRPAAFSLPWSAFPETLRIQIEDYLSAAAGYSLDIEFSRPQSQATIEKRRKQLLWYSSALVHSGVEASSLVSLTVILDAAMVKRGLEFLLKRREGKTYPALSNLAQFLPALARRIGLPAETVVVLNGFKRRLRIERHGIADRHLATLNRFDDPKAVEELLGLSQKLRQIVERSPRKGWREAKLLQTAVAIELLLVAPVRISNLVSIEIDRHLVTISVNPRQVHLQFPATEVKNGVSLEFPLPDETLDLIDLYLREYRPLLMKGPSNLLFPGKKSGRSKVTHALSLQINKTVYKHTGLEMPAHRFRHAVGKIFLDRNPGQYEVVRLLLGHKNIKTTIEFYCGSEAPAALRHYWATIRKARNGDNGGGNAR